MSFTRRIVRKLKAIRRLPLCRSLMRLRYNYQSHDLQRNLFGISFKNPFGLAHGLDKQMKYADELSIFGFSFIEMDCSNLKEALSYVRTPLQNVVKAACIDPARMDSPLVEERISLARKSFSFLYDFVDMFVICTDGYLSLASSVDPMLDTRIGNDTYKPIVIKILPDTPEEDLEPIVKYCMLYGIDGVMTVPALLEKAIDIASDRIAVIAAGGCPTPEEASHLLECGASLVELDPAVLMNGPGAVRKLLKTIDKSK